MVYKVAKPTEARIALFTDNWLGASIAAVIGLVGLAGGLLVRRAVRREARANCAHERRASTRSTTGASISTPAPR